MFKDLLKTKRTNSNQSNGGMQRVNVTSESTNFEPVETNGSALLNSAEELEQHDPSSSVKQNEDGEQVIELDSPGETIGDEDTLPESLSIDLENSSCLDTFFTESEIEELQSYDERISQQDKETSKRVNAVIQDPDVPEVTDLASAWKYACKKQGVFGMSEEEEYDNKQQAVRDQLSDRDWVESPPEEREVSDLTGAEFKEMLAEGMGESDHTEEEELSEADEQTQEQDNTIESVPEELAQAASSAWEQRGGVWETLSSDLQTDVENTTVESTTIDGEKRKQIRTTNDKLIGELKQLHKNPEVETTLSKEGGSYLAIIPEGVEV